MNTSSGGIKQYGVWIAAAAVVVVLLDQALGVGQDGGLGLHQAVGWQAAG